MASTTRGETAIHAGARPVFIVGTSRSGTSMLREMLSRQSSIWIVRETHYFDDLRPRLGPRASRPAHGEDRARCERYFLTLMHSTYGQEGQIASRLDETQALSAEAERLGGTPDAYFAAFCRLRARAKGKDRWGEKTPRHVYRIPEILSAFPSAQVVCLVRDPRGMIASYRDWKRKTPTGESREELRDRQRIQKSYNVVLQALLWRSAMQASLRAARRYGPERVRLQSYEALVVDPERELGQLCGWLDLEYEAAMLAIPVVHSSYAESAAAGVSTAPIDRWRNKLSPGEVKVIESACGSLMTRLGYARERPDASPYDVLKAWLSVPTAFFRAASVNRGRIGRMPEYVGRRMMLALRGGSSAPK